MTSSSKMLAVLFVGIFLTGAFGLFEAGRVAFAINSQTIQTTASLRTSFNTATMINGQVDQMSTVTFKFVSTASPTKTTKHWGQLILEAYDWQNTGNLVLALRNVGNTTLAIQNATWYVGGVQQKNITTCSSGLAPTTYCKTTIAISGLNVTRGVAYQIAITPPSPEQGQGFMYSAIAGELDWVHIALPQYSKTVRNTL